MQTCFTLIHVVKKCWPEDKIDFNIDEIEACCESLIADELEYLAPAGMNDSVKVKAFIARLRKAEKDAARYRWLREQAWNKSELCVVRFPKDAVKLGHYCPSFWRLDSFIDAAIAAEGEKE